MEKIDISKRDLTFLGVLCMTAAVLTVMWMALTGNGAQVYKDIVIEWTAGVRSNKSAEIMLLRLLLLFGCAAIFCYFKFFHKDVDSLHEAERIPDATTHFMAWICSAIILGYLIRQHLPTILLLALCLAALACMIQRNCTIATLCLFFFSYYASFAVYHALNFLGSYGLPIFGNMDSCPASVAFVIAILTAGLPLFSKNRLAMTRKAVLAVQLVLPALFLVLSLKEYNDHGTNITIGIPFQAKTFIVIAVILAFADALRVLMRNWKKGGADISSIIGIGSCICIACFNVYGGSLAVVDTDMHHPYENIFAFQQVFELGQIPYRDFIPPSGLYSIVHGAFFKLFGNGNIAYLSLCDNIFFYTLLAATLLLLQFHVKKIWCLALVLFLAPSRYDRVAFMSITVLLLLLPQLMKRPNLWLKVFLLVSVFHGLYYPVYGVACFVGFVPLFFIQLRKVIQDYGRPYRTRSFWISWAATLAILASSLPFLWGTFIHIKAMAGQSTVADGISIFGQKLPGWFMPYAKNIFRYPVYNAMHFIPLLIMVYLPAIFLCRGLLQNGSFRRPDFAFIEKNIEFFTMAISLLLIPIISYSYSFIRIDMFNFLSRSHHAMLCPIILYMVFVAKHVAASPTRPILLLLMNLIIASSGAIAVDNIGGKMFSQKSVPDGYVLVKDFGTDTVGKCFMNESTFNWLKSAKRSVDEINGEPSFAKMGSFGLWYIFRQKGAANLEGSIMKGFGAAQETKENIIRNRAVVGNIDPLTTYYLFNWLVASGEYVWDADRNLFVANENIGDYGEIKKRNLDCPLFYEEYDESNAANVFGLSFRTLRKLFTEQQLSCDVHGGEQDLSIEFDDYVHGKDWDFLYLEFEEIENEYETTEFDMGGEHEKEQSPIISRLFLKKKPNPSMQIRVTFWDEYNRPHSVKANYGNGRLLMNLGVGYRWLLEKHGQLIIEVLKDGKVTSVPEVKELRFLKCRQIFQERFDYANALVPKESGFPDLQHLFD